MEVGRETRQENLIVRTNRVVAGVVGTALVAALTVRGFVRRFAVHESSMAPTIEDGDWVIARRAIGPLERGDIVVFDDPAGSGLDLVKRVIGLPGEVIGIEGGRVTVNGALLADRWATGSTRPDGEWLISDDKVWLLGDNRAHSVSDGRVLGPTKIAEIRWVVVARYWPTARAGMLT
ncbi:MAG TPA: signal peptidase I [Acidimicrobiia bacterium]|nr:signal peptidase I [Acidimicrobiia bacterium]